MKQIKNSTTEDYMEPRRCLSPWRLLFALCLIIGLTTGSVLGWTQLQVKKNTPEQKPWFASYVDVTSTPFYPFEQLGASGAPNVVLSFIVASKTDPCTPSWGGYYSMKEAARKMDLDRRIARLKQQKGTIAISFGGLLNDELAVACTDTAKLMGAYKEVIERYNIDTIDLDLENTGLTDRSAGERRAQVIAQLQKQRRLKGKELAVWVTLPVAPSGLTKDGTDAVAQLLKEGVDLSGVNVMTMNYGSSKVKGDTMADASIRALTNTHRQLGVLYKQAGISLRSQTIWKKVGATPMIGQNDVREEVFTLDDAEALNRFAGAKGINRMSMWSANRDVPCGENYVDVKVVSDSCSGLKHEKFSYAKTLSKAFTGNITGNAGIRISEEPEAKEQKIDDPATSPYQVWKESGSYLEGTKVVWHGNVYEAKWWTRGDLPDNPVLQAWETPWQLIGPVLPGEKPIPQPTLPPGTFPAWSGTAEYEAGQRVLYRGLPYQAKWWTQGNSPELAESNSEDSPWAPMTQTQIEQYLSATEQE